jgi:hypothetical protein
VTIFEQVDIMARFAPLGPLGTPDWRKSSWSNYNGECVEVARIGGHVAVRDSKRPDGAVVVYSASEWCSFLAQAKHVPPSGQSL